MLTSTKLSWSHMDWNRSSHSDFIYITYTLAQPRNNLMSCIHGHVQFVPLKTTGRFGSQFESRLLRRMPLPGRVKCPQDVAASLGSAWIMILPNSKLKLHHWSTQPWRTNLGPRVRKYQGFVPCREMSDGWCTGWVWQMKPGGNGRHVPARRILAISSFQPTPQELYGLYGFTTAAAVIPAVKSVSCWEILFAQGELPMCFTINQYIYIYIMSVVRCHPKNQLGIWTKPGSKIEDTFQHMAVVVIACQVVEVY